MRTPDNPRKNARKGKGVGRKGLRSAAPSAGGRPTKLNAARLESICNAIIAGATYEAAAQYAGIDYQTLRNWMKQGEQDAAQNLETGFFEFFEALSTANARAQVNFALNIKDAAEKGDWRAAAWMLERRFAKQYGPRVGTLDEKSLDDAIESELARMVGERQAQVVGTAARAASGSQSDPRAGD